MSTEIISKHGLVAKSPFELYMAFVDMRNFLQMLPEDKRQGVVADYDTITAEVQGFKIGLMVKDRIPYSRIEFIERGSVQFWRVAAFRRLLGRTVQDGFPHRVPCRPQSDDEDDAFRKDQGGSRQGRGRPGVGLRRSYS